MNYISTRGNKSNDITASQAILTGIAPDYGLYVPESIPKLDVSLDKLIGMNYCDMAYEILKLYITDFTEEELKFCIKEAYTGTFSDDKIAPIKKSGGHFFLELYHGKTLAFKDVALSILPYFMQTAVKKLGIDKRIVILTATSGDTGKAALEGFADVDGFDIVVFYPTDGVSDVQKLQMTTQVGENTCVIGINGNFDDAQTGVKKIFTDNELAEKFAENNILLSSANSINIGRFIPQIVYYFYAYAQLVNSNEITPGEKINFTVPTGNFGNILAGYYAKLMGLPVDKLICASNKNNVLTEYFATNKYDINRKFYPTSSPSMDILISSNFERYLHDKVKTPYKIKEYMDALTQNGEYNTQNIGDDIIGAFADDEQAYQAIRRVFHDGYLIDTHTAVAFAAYNQPKEVKNDEVKNTEAKNEEVKNVILSTASPYKFSENVLYAITGEKPADYLESIKRLSVISNTNIPQQISELHEKPVLHKTICNTSEMQREIEKFTYR